MDSNHTLLTESRLLVLALPPRRTLEWGPHQSSVGSRPGVGEGAGAQGLRLGRCSGGRAAQVRVGRAPHAPTGPPFLGLVPAGRGEGRRCLRTVTKLVTNAKCGKIDGRGSPPSVGFLSSPHTPAHGLSKGPLRNLCVRHPGGPRGLGQTSCKMLDVRSRGQLPRGMCRRDIASSQIVANCSSLGYLGTSEMDLAGQSPGRFPSRRWTLSVLLLWASVPGEGTEGPVGLPPWGYRRTHW